MRSPARNAAFRILHCPICRLDLDPAELSLVCASGHCFDFARSGYINLVDGRRCRAASGGDGKAQLERRDAFLKAGHFDFISETIVRRLNLARPIASSKQLHVLDAGCGTGYHLSKVVDHLSGAFDARCSGLGVDVSKEAARIASRRLSHLAFVVSDLWVQWPIRSTSVDLLISIFAPKNFREMARVLRPGGLLAIAYPGAGHLVELRDEFGLMDILPGKSRSYLRELRALFGKIRNERVALRSSLDRDEVLNAILMGPNARRVSQQSFPHWDHAKTVTYDVELLLAQHPAGLNIGAH